MTTIPKKNAAVVVSRAALLLALSAPHFSTAATTIERMSLEKMSQTAPVIVRARCIENSTGWDAGEIWTFTSMQVEEIWKGSAPARILVRLLGGRVGDITSSVSGIPRFRAGEEVVLFLEPTVRGDFSVVSWQQGTFRVSRNSPFGTESVTQDTASFATFDPITRQFEATGMRNLPIDTLRARIEAALANSRGRMR
jgi:hypothetical protein